METVSSYSHENSISSSGNSNGWDDTRTPHRSSLPLPSPSPSTRFISRPFAQHKDHQPSSRQQQGQSRYMNILRPSQRLKQWLASSDNDAHGENSEYEGFRYDGESEAGQYHHRHGNEEEQGMQEAYEDDDEDEENSDNHGVPTLPVPPGTEATGEAHAAYGRLLTKQLMALHDWVEREKPSLREAFFLQLKLETHMADCAARCPDLWCSVWRFGDTLDPHDQSRGQRTSFQTLLFFELMQLRIYVRNLRIWQGMAPPWDDDERPQQFPWMVMNKMTLTKHRGIGQLSLAAWSQLMETVLLHWQSIAYHPELELYVSRLLDRMAVLVCFPHRAATFGNATMLLYIQPLRRKQAAIQRAHEVEDHENEHEEEEEGSREEEGYGNGNRSEDGGEEEEERLNRIMVDNLFLDERERQLARERRRAQRKANRVARCAALTQDQEREFVRQFESHVMLGEDDQSEDNLYAANFNLMYRCQLRCWQLTRALNQRRLLPRMQREMWLRKYPELSLGAYQRDHAREARLRLCLSGEQIKKRVEEKAVTVHPTLQEQLRHYMLHHVTAPEDWWWMAHEIPTSSRVPDAILEKLHSSKKNKLVDEVGRPAREWLKEKSPLRVGFVEYTALQLFDKVLPPEVGLFRKYVTLREHFERDLEILVTKGKRPRLVQLFSRYWVIYGGQVLDDISSIYEALSVWLRVIASDFGESRLWRLHLQPFLMDEQQMQEDRREEIVFL